MTRVAFRCDAASFIGTGHLMRCLTLAEALKLRGAESVFVMRKRKDSMEHLAESRGYKVYLLPELDNLSNTRISGLGYQSWLGCHPEEDAVQTLGVLKNVDFDWLVVDHYALDHNWEARVRHRFKKVLVIDDLANRRHVADLLLDQTFGRTLLEYEDKVEKNTEFFLGSGYALVRKEFFLNRQRSLAQKLKLQEPKRLLISLGGADPDDITGELISGLHDAGITKQFDHIDIVMGQPHISPRLVRFGNEIPQGKLHINVSYMADLMSDADCAIGAAGSSSWERCCLGLPTLMLIRADNQRYVARSLEEAGAAATASRIESLISMFPDWLSQLKSDYSSAVRKAAAITNGLGAGLISLRMIPEVLGDGRKVWLRHAEIGDTETIFEWQTEPETRRYARNPSLPSWEEHQAWMLRRLSSAEGAFLIIMVDSEPSGVLRVDPVDSSVADGEVSIFLAPELHGSGVGSAALRSLHFLFPQSRLLATVLPGNIPSRKLFEKMGYSQISETLWLYQTPCF